MPEKIQKGMPSEHDCLEMTASGKADIEKAVPKRTFSGKTVFEKVISGTAVSGKTASLMQECRLCPRNCGVNRMAGQKGFCGVDAELMVARAALHMWEEPCISGTEGSGAVFFSGCSMGCVFCQNRDISKGQRGKVITTKHLARLFLNLQEQGANNINLVTAGHFLPQTAEALCSCKTAGADTSRGV